MSARKEALAWLALATLFGLALVTIPRPRNVWVGHASNAAHVLISVAVAVVVLRVRRRLERRSSARRSDYVAALAAVALLGVGLEAAQAVGPGSPSLKDVGLDLMGGVAGLLMAGGWHARSRPWPARAALCAAGAGVTLLAVSPQLRVVREAARLRARWPTLADFESSGRNSFLGIDDGARAQFVDAPDGFTSARGRVALVTFASGRYPAFLVRPVRGGWRDYQALSLDVYSPETELTRLHLRVHDRRHDQSYGDRFNGEFEIRPGAQTIRVPLDVVARGPSSRRLDLDAVAALILFLDAPREPVRLYFDNIRLE